MKKLLQLGLGIVTSVGGFLEIGSISTAAQAGAGFGYQLIWVVVLGTACIAVLVEMSGRLAAVSKRTVSDALREHFGVRVFLAPLIVMCTVSLLVLSAEIGGVAAALELATGVRFPVWAVPVALVVWGLVWRAPFGVIEKGVSLRGLVTLAFAIGAVHVAPDYAGVARGFLPTLPKSDAAKYWFVAVSVLGASISPYLYIFYSSGAIEDKWTAEYLLTNRFIAALGMGFGGFLSIAVLILGAHVFPRGTDVEHYQQL